MKRLLPGLALLSAACGGSSRTSPPTVATVTVNAATSAIQIGQTTTLSASAKDIGGNPIQGRTVSWSSSATAVATVNASGLVTGVSTGSAVITATIEGKSGEVTIGVSASSNGVDCSATTPLSLNAGEVRVLSGSERSAICVSGGGSGSDYTLIAVNVAANRLGASVGLSSANTGAPLGPLASLASARLPSVSPRAITGAGQIAGAMPRDIGFETRLRSAGRAELRQLRAEAPGRVRQPSWAAGIKDLPSTPSIGSLINLNASSTSFCDVPQTRTARVMAVSSTAIVVEDTTAPAGGFSQAEYVSIATTFDTLVFPLDTALFGAPFDMDSNGRVLLFFTTAVNQRTSASSTSVIGGFFWERDLIPRTANATVPFSCATSNEGEMFYLPVVDAASKYNPFFTSKTRLLAEINGTTMHEFQHLINASHRFYITPEVVEDEEAWLNEGMSHIAEEVLYLHLAGKAERADLNFAQTTSPNAQLDLVTNYQVDNLARFNSYLRGTETFGAFQDNEDLPTRGAAWVLLRWAIDHSNGTESSLMHALVSAPTQGVPNFNNVFAGVGGLTGALRSTTIAHYADNLTTFMSPTYSHLSWNFRDWLPHFTANSGGYPLATSALIGGVPQQVALAAGGGAVFLRFHINSGATGSVAITISGAAPATGVEFALVRSP